MPNYELNFDAFLNHEDPRPVIARSLMQSLARGADENSWISPVQARDAHEYIRALEARCLTLYWQMYRMLEGYKRAELMTDAYVKLRADEALLRSINSSPILIKLASTSAVDLKKETEARATNLPDITEFDGRPGAL